MPTEPVEEIPMTDARNYSLPENYDPEIGETSFSNPLYEYDDNEDYKDYDEDYKDDDEFLNDKTSKLTDDA